MRTSGRILWSSALALAALLVVAAPASAQQVTLSTPYPAVAVEAGESVTFNLDVVASSPTRVELAVTQAPEGWTTTIRGGGFVTDAVFAKAKDPPTVELDVDVPAEATAGTYDIVVTATHDGEVTTLPLTVRIAEAAGGTVSLTGEFTKLQGSSDATFTFDLDLENNTPRQTSFALEGQGPPGWKVDVHPSGEAQATSTRVDAGGKTTISATVDPPDDAPAGAYPILVRATGGGSTAEIQLEADITGNFSMSFTTPSQVLTVDVRSGKTNQVPLVVVNDGTAPLSNVMFSSTPPSDWKVEFNPASIDVVNPGEAAQVVASITPSGDAISGDYVVSLNAAVPETSSSVDLRATVKGSRTWGFVGLGLIAAAVIGVGYVFRRFGRR